MRTYYWRDQSNYGDLIGPYILDKLGFANEHSHPDDAELVTVGSVLEHLPRYFAGTVCGAGKLHQSSKVNLSDARVFALRGKLTLAGVVGAGSPVLGDPALLVSLFVRQPSARYDLGVVSHWTDGELRRRYPYGHFIDAAGKPEHVIAEIASCKRIISSGLHGLIVADSFGIPRQAERHNAGPQEGGDFKYLDYQSIYSDSDVHWGEMWLAPRAEVERTQAGLLSALKVAAGIDLSLEDARHPDISLLVPFRDDGQYRSEVWAWLRRYWRDAYPEAEIIQGHYDDTPYSKSAAVNDAAKRARGRVFAVLDADAYLQADVLRGIVSEIEAALHSGQRKWFVPFDALYRLGEDYTKGLIKGSPSVAIPMPPAQDLLENAKDAISYGHQYGALCQVMPREAFELVHGMDPRFRGWGAEDVSFLRALDTLYAQHEVRPGPICHLWHARSGPLGNSKWVGQSWGNANTRLAQRYSQAVAEPAAMMGLALEHPLG